MSPELKAKWIAALRSGKYKQGTGCLRTFDEKFCCLGVLADINGENWQKPGKKTGREEYFITDSLDKAFPEKFGHLGRKYDSIVPSHHRAKLICMNDNPTSTFSEIADWIEENV